MKHRHGAGARRDHHIIGESDPLVAILTEELIANSPVCGLVFAPVRVDLSGDRRGQLIGNAFHGTPRDGSNIPSHYINQTLSAGLSPCWPSISPHEVARFIPTGRDQIRWPYLESTKTR
jgi:hypothetical protein